MLNGYLIKKIALFHFFCEKWTKMLHLKGGIFNFFLQFPHLRHRVLARKKYLN